MVYTVMEERFPDGGILWMMEGTRAGLCELLVIGGSVSFTPDWAGALTLWAIAAFGLKLRPDAEASFSPQYDPK